MKVSCDGKERRKEMVVFVVKKDVYSFIPIGNKSRRLGWGRKGVQRLEFLSLIVQIARF
jgi:triacylglycerol esterase/lipase EstA (alpha/beta hydrolase family)